MVEQTPKNSEENIKDNSQVSAENRMYNIGRHGFENMNKVEEKCKGENCKQKRITVYEGEKSRGGDTDTTNKLKKKTKGRSRYIIESKPKDTTTAKAVSKDSEKEMYNQMKESMNFIEENLISGTKKSKKKKQKKKDKVIPYKLLSNFDFNNNKDVKDVSPETDMAVSLRREVRKSEKEKKKGKIQHRTFDDEIVLVRNAALENDDKKTVKNEPEHGKNVSASNEKPAKSGSLVIENDDQDKWWEKELPKHNQDDANFKKKSWF